jgi:hypothetical protein
MKKYTFKKQLNADGTTYYEMFVFGTPWGRFSSKEEGIANHMRVDIALDY